MSLIAAGGCSNDRDDVAPGSSDGPDDAPVTSPIAIPDSSVDQRTTAAIATDDVSSTADELTVDRFFETGWADGVWFDRKIFLEQSDGSYELNEQGIISRYPSVYLEGSTPDGQLLYQVVQHSTVSAVKVADSSEWYAFVLDAETPDGTVRQNDAALTTDATFEVTNAEPLGWDLDPGSSGMTLTWSIVHGPEDSDARGQWTQTVSWSRWWLQGVLSREDLVIGGKDEGGRPSVSYESTAFQPAPDLGDMSNDAWGELIGDNTAIELLERELLLRDLIPNPDASDEGEDEEAFGDECESCSPHSIRRVQHAGAEQRAEALKSRPTTFQPLAGDPDASGVREVPRSRGGPGGPRTAAGVADQVGMTLIQQEMELAAYILGALLSGTIFAMTEVIRGLDVRIGQSGDPDPRWPGTQAKGPTKQPKPKPTPQVSTIPLPFPPLDDCLGGGSAARDEVSDWEREAHHIASNKGRSWATLFRALFDAVGVSINSKGSGGNLRVLLHRGYHDAYGYGHSPMYHKWVYDNLKAANGDPATFRRILDALAKFIEKNPHIMSDEWWDCYYYSEEDLGFSRRTSTGRPSYDISKLNKIDPSGIVIDERGQPLPDVRIDLLQTDAEGTLYPPEDASGANPQFTSANGRFSWDVVAGRYLLHLRCPHSSAEQQPDLVIDNLVIPPPVVNLRLDLRCGGGVPGP